MSHHVNEINNEQWMIFQWENDTKKRIIGISNQLRKEKEWSKYFPTQEKADDSYITNGLIF